MFRQSALRASCLLLLLPLVAPVLLAATRATSLLLSGDPMGQLGSWMGLLLAFGGLRGVKALYGGYDHLVQLDGRLLLIAVGLALLSSLAAGLYPAWRAVQLAPAGLKKTQ